MKYCLAFAAVIVIATAFEGLTLDAEPYETPDAASFRIASTSSGFQLMPTDEAGVKLVDAGIECTRCRTFAQCEAGDNCLSVVSCSDETEHERCLTTKPCKLKAHANRQVSLHANCENNDGGYINGNSTFTDSVLNMLLTNCDLPACNYEGHPEELGGVRNLADGGSEFLVRARSRAAARALRRCLHRQVIAGCEVQRMPRRVKSIVGTGVYAP